MKRVNKYLCLMILLIFWLDNSVFCGFEQYEAGSRARGMGGAFVGLADECWAIYYNPAGLGKINLNELGVFYTPGQFGLNELSSATLAGNYKTGIGTFGLGFRKFGFELYKEISGTLSYGNSFFGIFIGSSFNYNSVSIRNYGSDGVFGIDIGALIPLFRDFYFGISVKNINNPTIGRAKEKLPQVFMTGFSYAPIKNLILAADYQKEVKFFGVSRFGVEYNFEFLSLRIGVSDNPATFSSGIGLKYSFIQIDYAFFTHQELGLTQSGSIKIIWGGRDD